MQSIRSRPFWLSIGLLITDGLYFGLTNPVKVASIMLIIGFGLVVLSFYWLFYNLQKFLAVYAPWLGGQKYLCLTATAAVGTILALQSVGQLTARDALLIPLAAAVLYAYLTYGKKSASSD